MLIESETLKAALIFNDKTGEITVPNMREVFRVIDSQPPFNPWHRVEDGLPKSGEFGEIVIVCNDVGTVNAAYLSSNRKWYAANNTMYDAWTWMPNVTHWMPLPEPPKEENK